MGLDIYLYRITATKEEFDAREALREAMDKAGNDCYPPDAEFKLLTQEEQDAVYERSKAAKKKLAKAHGLKADKYGDVKSLEEEVNLPSAKYPEHYFKIGYFRSSYNDGGIDSYFRRLGLPDLHEIMGRGDDDEYRFAPDWKASKDRAIETLARLDAMPNTDIDVMGICANEFIGVERLPKNEAEARAIVLEEIGNPSKAFEAWSSANGSFYPKGLDVIGLVPGLTDGFTKTMFGKAVPCVYVAYKKNDNGFYRQALEIIVETCDHVLSQPDPQAFYLHWSG